MWRDLAAGCPRLTDSGLAGVASVAIVRFAYEICRARPVCRRDWLYNLTTIPAARAIVEIEALHSVRTKVKPGRAFRAPNLPIDVVADAVRPEILVVKCGHARTRRLIGTSRGVTGGNIRGRCHARSSRIGL